jgi:hypothetical protein
LKESLKDTSTGGSRDAYAVVIDGEGDTIGSHLCRNVNLTYRV